jgi:predicted Zn-dependent peptidase
MRATLAHVFLTLASLAMPVWAQRFGAEAFTLNVVLVGAGDIGRAEVRSLAEKHFAPVPVGLLPPHRRVEEPGHNVAARLELAPGHMAG